MLCLVGPVTAITPVIQKGGQGHMVAHQAQKSYYIQISPRFLWNSTCKHCTMSCPRVHMHGPHYKVYYARIAALLLKIQSLEVHLWLLQQKLSDATQDKTAIPLSEWDFRNKQSGWLCFPLLQGFLFTSTAY